MNQRNLNIGANVATKPRELRKIGAIRGDLSRLGEDNILTPRETVEFYDVLAEYVMTTGAQLPGNFRTSLTSSGYTLEIIENGATTRIITEGNLSHYGREVRVEISVSQSDILLSDCHFSEDGLYKVDTTIPSDVALLEKRRSNLVASLRRRNQNQAIQKKFLDYVSAIIS